MRPAVAGADPPEGNSEGRKLSSGIVTGRAPQRQQEEQEMMDFQTEEPEPQQSTQQRDIAMRPQEEAQEEAKQAPPDSLGAPPAEEEHRNSCVVMDLEEQAHEEQQQRGPATGLPVTDPLPGGGSPRPRPSDIVTGRPNGGSAAEPGLGPRPNPLICSEELTEVLCSMKAGPSPGSARSKGKGPEGSPASAPGPGSPGSLRPGMSMIFRSGRNRIRDGEIVSRPGTAKSVRSVEGSEATGVTRLKDVWMVEEPEAEEPPHHWTRAAILRTVVMVVVILAGTVLLAITAHVEHPELEKLPHGASHYAVGPGQPAVIDLTDEPFHSYVEVQVYMYHPPPHANLTVRLEADKTSPAARQAVAGRTWEEVGKWEVRVADHHCSQHWFLEKHRFTGPEGAVQGLRLRCDTETAQVVPVAIKSLAMPAAAYYEVVIAGIILLGVYTLIIFELVPRTLVAMIGATVTVCVYSMLHERPSIEYIVTWIDYETVILLFGMMVMVQILSSTGAFEKVTLYGLRWSRGDPWKLIVLLGIGVSVASAFLDNVTCMLLLTPVCIRLCQTIHIPPQPVLIATAVMSNIGGAATGVGDPPNIIVLNYPGVRATGIGFAEFSLHCTLGTLLCVAVALLQIKLQYRSWFASMATAAKRQAAADPATPATEVLEPATPATPAPFLPRPAGDGGFEDKCVVRTQPFPGGITYSTQNIEMRVTKTGYGHSQDAIIVHLAHFQDRLESALPSHAEKYDGKLDFATLEAQYKIKDKVLLINCGIVLAVVVLLFFLSSVLKLHLTLSWIAILGFMTLVLLADTEMEPLLVHVEWGTLLFFAALFVLMHGLEKLGLIEWIGSVVVRIVALAPVEHRLTVGLLLLLWVSGFASAFVDNIPYTAAMCPVILHMAKDLDLPVRPLVWTLALGACMGGNGTLIGASANVVTAGLAQHYGYPVSFNAFFKTGFPVMIGSMVTLTGYLLLVHSVLGWDVR